MTSDDGRDHTNQREADTIRELRKFLGHTQLRFAETMGVSLMTVSRWERGEVAVPGPAQRLAQLILALRPAVEWLRSKESS